MVDDRDLNTVSHTVLFFDGACALCNSTVRFILDHEREHTLRFATLDGKIGDQLLSKHPQLRGIDSIVVLVPASRGKKEEVLVRSDAALHLATYLRGFWSVFALARHLPPRLRDAVYDLIARHRHRFPGLRSQHVTVNTIAGTRLLDTYPGDT